MFRHLQYVAQRVSAALIVCALACAHVGLQAKDASSVYLEDLTWLELRDRIGSGTTTAIVPIGGTEQNGPHMVLGKHNVRVRALAGSIAQALGNAVVAPVIAYVPEGSIRPPAAHMRFTGTLSLPEPVFEAMLEATARSLKQHGVRDVVLVGDHGGYQKNMERVAHKLNREWAGDSSTRVHAVLAYYAASQTPYTDDLKGRGYSMAEIGTHAGLADTAFALAIDPSMVRITQLQRNQSFGAAHGTYGDPRRATAELGQFAVQNTVKSSVAAIRAAIAARLK